LVNRLAAGGYVRRRRGNTDRREVLVSLTVKGDRVLAELSIDHWAELRTQGPLLLKALKKVMQSNNRSRSGKEKN